MRRLSLYLIAMLVVGLLPSACKPKVPSRYLQPDEMEDLMYDFYVSQGISGIRDLSPDYQHRYNLEAVFKKHGISDAEFDSSLVFYYNHMEQMNVIYSNIQKRLSEEALDLGASEGEVERYTIQSVSGNTTDVWEGKRNLLLLPTPPYHIVQFTQKADTSFHKGDSFLLTFGTSFLVRGGIRNATAYLAVTYDNDSVVCASSNISASSGTTLRLSPCDQKAEKIDVFFYLSRRDQVNNASELCLLFLNHIQLMRFHHSKDAKKPETVGIPITAPMRIDTIDSLRPKVHRLGEHPFPVKNVKPINNQ